MFRIWQRARPLVWAAAGAGAVGAAWYSRAPPPLVPRSTAPLESLAPPRYCSPAQLEAAVGEIAATVGASKVTRDPAQIAAHTENGYSPRPQHTELPRFVLYAELTEDVSQMMRICFKYNVPVVPYSGGTALEGHFFSTRAGVVLDTSRMKRILRVNEDDLDAVVEAGVGWVQLNEKLASAGLMFGCDCAPHGLIGGMVSTNALGINASRYGAMAHNVVSLTVVLADGTVIKTRQRPKKSSAGYNLTALFTGSEGTLGIVTEATVRLHVKPPVETVAVGQFALVEDTTKTVAQLYRLGVRPEAVELLDRNMMKCTNYSGYFSEPWLEVPTVFFKLGGTSKAAVAEQLEVVRRAAEQNNCQLFLMARSKEEEEELFSARKNAFYALFEYGQNAIDPDVRVWITDVAVPLSRLSSVLGEVERLIEALGLEGVILGHVGDGNFHADIFYRDSELDRCRKLVNEITMVGLRNEGTASGEHGIGNGKRAYLPVELGQEAVDTMRAVKLALDPKRILNPDKVFKTDPDDKGEY